MLPHAKATATPVVHRLPESATSCTPWSSCGSIMPPSPDKPTRSTRPRAPGRSHLKRYVSSDSFVGVVFLEGACNCQRSARNLRRRRPPDRSGGLGGLATDRRGDAQTSCTAGYKAMWSKENGFPSKEYFGALEPGVRGRDRRQMTADIRPVGKKAGGLSNRPPPGRG